VVNSSGCVSVLTNFYSAPLPPRTKVEAGETVTWKVLDRTHWLWVRLPQRKPLKGQAVPGRKKSRWVQEDRP